jgi:hypothetical protein
MCWKCEQAIELAIKKVYPVTDYEKGCKLERAKRDMMRDERRKKLREKFKDCKN